MKKGKWLTLLGACMAFIYMNTLQVDAAPLQSNPNVSWAPSGKAFTTDAGEIYYTAYPKGTTVEPGGVSSLSTLEEGQHYYFGNKDGVIPVEKWEVRHTPGRCVHGLTNMQETLKWTEPHGIDFRVEYCENFYKSGWIGTCADCHGDIPLLIYMDAETAASISEIPNNIGYYYLCPRCNHLEQGATIKHDCKMVSWNKYEISYKSNARKAEGNMTNSTFMYNNETVYEGKMITPETKLKRCSFVRVGYEFSGWNTMPDGSGRWFKEGEEILNLSSDNEDEITLYAQWEKCESELYIDPNGGSFDGQYSTTYVKQGYGTTFSVSGSLVIPPPGPTVSFETNGGTDVADMEVELYFDYWKMSSPFFGVLEENIYTFGKTNKAEDYLTAQYGCYAITLPETRKPDTEFGGWYKDAACTIPAGQPEDEIIITEDTTLYAQWVSLQLMAIDDYTVFGGSGAVDLSWVQNDSYIKTYRLYQSLDNKTWKKLSYSGNSGTVSVSEEFTATGTEENFIVPYSGLYTLTLTGAQGENHETHIGGKGGRIKATVWLTKGEVLTYKIGTTEGFNGGGTGEYFGNGGGMTSISSDQKGLLMIAGGGGGASAFHDGEPGGASLSVTESAEGQSGGVGGGGGYQGGSAGTVTLHTHLGLAGQQEANGCYTVPITTTAICTTEEARGNECQKYHKDGDFTYYGYGYGWCNSHTELVFNYWKGTIHHDCGIGGASGGKYEETGDITDTYTFVPTGRYTYCHNCAASGKNGFISEVGKEGVDGTHEYEITTYDLGCGKEGVENATKAYGGSNYINNVYCTIKSEEHGIGEGDGTLQIELSSVEYIDNLFLQDVPAPDLTAPAMVDADSVTKTSILGSTVRIVWDVPEDYGTTYYHRAESYNALTGEKLCDSNITFNHLLSGVKGYRYVLDSSETTVVTNENGMLIETNGLTLAMTEEVQYLHLATVDVAGNISASIHVLIGKKDPEVAWRIYTRQLEINGTDSNIYAAANKLWYVRADGETPFGLKFDAKLDTAALDNYQINYMCFDIMDETDGVSQLYRTYTRKHVVEEGEFVSGVGEIEKSMSGEVLLEDAAYTVTTRSNICRNLNLVQHFVLQENFDKHALSITPVAGAEHGENVAYSDWEEDKLNAIRIIGDGKAPAVEGTDKLEKMSEIDWEEDSILIDLSCSDDGSGVKEFYVIVENRDNYVTRRFEPDDTGHIIIDLVDDSDYAFAGDFTLTIHAIDNVGNDSLLSYETEKFSLTASVARKREPRDGVFKRGDAGVLTIVTTGYVDRVEVEILNPILPEGVVFEYENPEYLQQESVSFWIPLDTPEGTYTFVIYAYKNGKRLNAQPVLGVFELSGTVLDEFRRKINWNS